MSAWGLWAIVGAMLLAGCQSGATGSLGVATDGQGRATEGAATEEQAHTERPERVAVLDVQAIFERSQVGQRALAALLAEFGQQRRRLTEEEVSLKEQALALEQARLAHSPDELHEQSKRYLDGLERYRERVHAFNQELATRHRALIAAYLPKIIAVAKPLAEREGYSTILHQGRPDTVMIVFYHAPDIDLTDRVIAELDRASGL